MNRLVLALALASFLTPAPASAGDKTFTCDAAGCSFTGEIDPQTTALFKGVCTLPGGQSPHGFMHCIPKSNKVSCKDDGIDCTCSNDDPKALGYASVGILCDPPDQGRP